MNTQMKTLMSQHIFNSDSCRILFACCLSALCLVTLSTQAANITVTNGIDGAPGSLAASRRGFAFCVADPVGSAHEFSQTG